MLPHQTELAPSGAGASLLLLVPGWSIRSLAVAEPASAHRDRRAFVVILPKPPSSAGRAFFLPGQGEGGTVRTGNGPRFGSLGMPGSQGDVHPFSLGGPSSARG